MAASLLDPLLAFLAVAWERRGWLVIVAFLAAVVAEFVDRDRARYVHVVAWVCFAVFWASMVPYFVFVQKSIVEGLGAIVAVPLSAAVAYRIVQGRQSLFVLTRVVAIGGLVYFPVVELALVRQPLIEIVTDHTAFLMQLIGYDPTVVSGMTVTGPDGTVYTIAEKTYPYDSTFRFEGTTRPITYTIAMACTGIGSMAIFGGLIGAVSAPASRKLRALLVSIPVIYALNLLRNVFIGIGFGEQYFQVFPGFIMWAFGLDSPAMVSYIVTDRIIAQLLSVVALIAITWLVVRELPEVLDPIEDALFVATGREYDLQAALGVGTADESAD